jgi:hypothetical protein
LHSSIHLLGILLVNQYVGNIHSNEQEQGIVMWNNFLVSSPEDHESQGDHDGSTRLQRLSVLARSHGKEVPSYGGIGSLSICRGSVGGLAGKLL